MENLISKEDVGYIKAKLEEVLDNQKEYGVRLKSVEEQLSIYKTIIKVARIFIGVSAAVITWKFHHIGEIYNAIVNGD